MLKVIALVFSTLVMTGCVQPAKTSSTRPPQLDGPETVLQPARGFAHQPPAQVRIVKVPVPSPQLRPLPKQAQNHEKQVEPAPAQGTHQSQSDADLATIAKNTKLATGAISDDSYVRAVQYYDYMPGTVYPVYCAPGYVTSIALKPGELVKSTAAGDTTRWQVIVTTVGAGAGEQGMLIIKPLRPNISTNLLIATDQRIYQLDLKSVEGEVYNTAVAWNYPADSLVTHHQPKAGDSPRQGGAVAKGIAFEDLDFGYSVTMVQPPRAFWEPEKKVEKPAWFPLRVFHDGAKTYIQFPANLGVLEAPPLFVLKHKDDTEGQIINYRVKGTYYVVDQILRAAALRMGDEPQQTVWIQYKGKVGRGDD